MQQEDKEFGSICAVIVTYNAGSDFIQSFKSLINQVTHAVVVDNGSDPETLGLLKELTMQYPGFLEVHHNTKNNLAQAQNIGIRQALQQGYEWILLLDHDSTLAPYMVQRMKEAWQRRRAPRKIGIIAPIINIPGSEKVPAYVIPFMGMFFQRVRFNGQPTISGVLDVIASGSLIPASVFQKVGYMDESFIIDYVDKDFCMRLRRAGYAIMVVKDAVLYHHLGKSADYHWMGMTVTVSNHSPERRYFITRNRVRTWGRYMFSCPSYVLHDIIAAKFDVLRILFGESRKLEKLKSILRGTKDALLKH